ncbi:MULTISPECIES: CmlA/FloR family chloramphenicol efflux MFS transporter [unclassified Mesorhizobium]|uniref:CmlA/FloR family chloramphenicol efflux MFS transporter n=1 Tax=unclassified Mesorhizobium TaxID=325217 RepID=UPI00112C9AC3|nr:MULTISPECIES: CmlA/FloR family chloramphenicol efflux MFS transporter [unclassified Mesorhizobium]TPI51813.1 CmlA/FloR family chloramphenicol efflux MFS transporter [Mesorhizobium sp. B3-1-1]TPJ61550.1 CmlA/FloR family chloramphenicol efflux MFS transporter [Mesorhizobium sp. B2-6-7]TPJ85051.1 CmlA/FloR family chloramphenicol efflux MFS transporter [Mesorhizobium sp. B2-6-3]TPJ99212.1 CmlA/FloR family chloramphenicol efflux MFS transporter [Mesorhizobium sp. B2-5-10]TPK10960.1 CmlA/FloR fam
MSYPKRPIWAYSLSSALLLMAPFDILASLAMDIYLPVVPAMPAALGTTPDVVQLTLSLYMVTLGLGQVVFGPISDRIGRRPVLIGGGLLFAGASFLLAGTSLATAFVALRVLQAIGASAVLVATFATVRDVYAQRHEGTVIYGLFSSMLAFVPALGPIAGALIADSFGWRAIFITLAVLAMLATLQAWLRWHETKPLNGNRPHAAFRSILGSFAFWTYTLGFAAAMGTFFVFFSTAPRVLIDGAGFSQIGFSFAFATAALVMIATTRFVKAFTSRWGIAGSLARGMAMLLFGAAMLAIGQLSAAPSFATFILPMWVMAVGIVFAASVTANGALEAFSDVAGTAVALYFCAQSLIVGIAGTSFVLLLGGDTAWPLVFYAAVFAAMTLCALSLLPSRRAENA